MNVVAGIPSKTEPKNRFIEFTFSVFFFTHKIMIHINVDNLEIQILPLMPNV